MFEIWNASINLINVVVKNVAAVIVAPVILFRDVIEAIAKGLTF